jgi:hypothetical protein
MASMHFDYSNRRVVARQAARASRGAGISTDAIRWMSETYFQQEFLRKKSPLNPEDDYPFGEEPGEELMRSEEILST